MAAVSALVVATGFVVWAARVLADTGPTWDATTPEQYLAAVRGDAVGNMGILGFVFTIAFLNSLGGTRVSAQQQSEWVKSLDVV